MLCVPVQTIEELTQSLQAVDKFLCFPTGNVQILNNYSQPGKPVNTKSRKLTVTHYNIGINSFLPIIIKCNPRGDEKMMKL